MEVIICIICSIAISAITTKILATHYFKIVDGYVEDICDDTKRFVKDTESKIYKRLQMIDQEE